MLQLILAVVLAAAAASSSPAKPAQPPAPAPAPAASQPAVVVITEQDAPGVLGRSRFAELFDGKKQVTLDEMRDIGFWSETLRDLARAMIAFVPRLVVGLLFLVFFYAIYRTTRKVLLASMTRALVDPSIRDMLGLLLKWSILGFGLVIACNQIGIQVAALLTGVGVVGLAIGFAAQETLANFIAGVVIFWDKPFQVGDWLSIDGMFGQVRRVTFRSTRILNMDGQIVIMPNTAMLSSKLVNHTTHPVERVRVDIGIAYKESIEEARQVILGIVRDDERICPEPAPAVAVIECAGSSVNLALFFWIRDESIVRKIRAEYLEKAKCALDAAGIQIPYPHMQLFMEETPAVERLAGTPLRKAG